MSSPILPDGYVFSPTDREIVELFLRRKVRNESLPHDVVTICHDLYDKEPWQIFDKNAKEIFYVFTNLKRKDGGARKERKVGSGTWNGQNTKEIFSGGVRIGWKRMFSFDEEEESGGNRGCRSKNGRWIMHEYSTDDSDNLVLCRIRNKDNDRLYELAEAETPSRLQVTPAATASTTTTASSSSKRTKVGRRKRNENDTSQSELEQQQPRLSRLLGQEANVSSSGCSGLRFSYSLPGAMPELPDHKSEID